MEDIVSSILFYTVYYTGDIEGMLSELEEIKETLTKSSIPFEATHHTKSLISHGIREYRRHSNNPNSNDRLFEDIKKLKLHELYVDNAKQEITRSATKQLEYELSTGPSLGEEKEE
ncbi:MAG: hypothetical protein LBI53_06110 [Candidatus Peribacteria bacterium]|jgi:hypothetical protein|nr:hypothetical protein [Candidatus Peribacteria bacterium]